MDKSAIGDFPGGRASRRRDRVLWDEDVEEATYLLLILLSHSHEHLGQLIAYARSNDVTPPWSEPKEGE